MELGFVCPRCGQQYSLDSTVATVSASGAALSPCTPLRAAEEVDAGRAEWHGDGVLRVLQSPTRKVVKAHVRRRDNYVCQWCGEFGSTVDHVVPESLGGPTKPGNLVCACEECNQARLATPAAEFAAIMNVPIPVPGRPLSAEEIKQYRGRKRLSGGGLLT